ncbi:MAG: RimK-like ATPgrasp N-terminal domain-containing protein, partial [Planctomycetota bacterium]
QDLLDRIERSLRPLKSDVFDVSIYFGRNVAARYDALSLAIFNQFPAPLLRAKFARSDGHWRLEAVRLIGLAEVPETHLPFLLESAARYFQRAPRRRVPKPARYALAILHDPSARHQPSNDRALRKFIDAAEARSMRAELIERDAYGRLSEFDALFIRETTAVNHHTFRFARRARAQGLAVIDDPESILRCTNKVFLKELLERHRIAIPKSVIISPDSANNIGDTIGFPCVVKRPDESFSTGVHKFDAQAEYEDAREDLFRTSELLIVQEFMPTDFDWRIGILNLTPLFACRYHMARRHWQIVRHTADNAMEEGAVDTLPVDQAPSKVVALATQAASLIGNGLYGVDIKEVNGRPYIIEINDNPNIDAGFEDRVLRDELYDRIMRFFIEQIELRRASRP